MFPLCSLKRTVIINSIVYTTIFLVKNVSGGGDDGRQIGYVKYELFFYLFLLSDCSVFKGARLAPYRLLRPWLCFLNVLHVRDESH